MIEIKKETENKSFICQFCDRDDLKGKIGKYHHEKNCLENPKNQPEEGELFKWIKDLQLILKNG